MATGQVMTQSDMRLSHKVTFQREDRAQRTLDFAKSAFAKAPYDSVLSKSAKASRGSA